MATSGVVVEAVAAGLGLPRSSIAVGLKALRDDKQIRTGARGVNALHLTTEEAVRILIGATAPTAVAAADAVEDFADLRTRRALPAITAGFHDFPSLNPGSGWLAARRLKEYLPNNWANEAAAKVPLNDLAPGTTFSGALQILLEAYMAGSHKPTITAADFPLPIPEGANLDATLEIVVEVLRPAPAARIHVAVKAAPGVKLNEGREEYYSRTLSFGDDPGRNSREYFRLLREKNPEQYWGSAFFFNERVFEVLASVMKHPEEAAAEKRLQSRRPARRG